MDPSTPTPEPLMLDLGDFDALGVAGAVVGALRVHAIEAEVDAVAKVAAPAGWHRVNVTARPSGHVVLGVRYEDLTAARRHNVERALAQREWDRDDTGDGATRRYPPGTDPTTPAFELLAVLTLAGAPADTRTVTATDATGAPVPLS